MDFSDVTKNITDQTNYRLDQRMDELFRKNPKYRHLDEENRKLVFDLVKKYKDKLKRGLKPSRYTIKEDMYQLYYNRLKFNLTYRDLDEIRDILMGFKK